jgi:TonB-linked SusC/RagA family outer membrane protein
MTPMHRRLTTTAVLTALATVAWPPLARAQQPPPQPITVSGTVTNETGQPMQGASVALVGLGLGAMTTEAGKYSFIVPAARASGQAATLEARRLGFKPVQFAVTLTPGTPITHDFVLTANPLQLGEVVVTGAGTATQAERIGTVRTPVDSAAIQRSNETNVVNALAAKAPGVTVTSQSGSPGSSASIRIRGLNTIQGTGQPLFVVDGTPIDNSTNSTTGSTGSTDTPNRASDINPEDIESVEILKSGAAAAIYGARAGQGVVLITTKSGKLTGGITVSLRSTTRMDQLYRSEPLQREYGQGTGGEGVTCSAPDCSLTSTTWGPKLAPGTPTWNHSTDLFENALTYDNTLAVSGGSDRTTFYLSGGSSNQNGVVIGNNDRYDRYSVRLKASQLLPGGFRVDGNVAYVDDRGQFVQKGSNTSGVSLGSWRTPPEFNNFEYLDPESGLQRSFRFPNPSSASINRSRGYDNPVFAIKEQDNNQQVGRAFGNIGLSYDPKEWVSLRLTVGADYVSDERLETLPKTSSSFPTGQVVRGNLVNYQLDNNLTATFTRSFMEGFESRLVLGGNLSSRNFRQDIVTGQDLIAPEPFVLTNTTTRTPNDFRSLVRGESYYAQYQQEFWRQLYLTGTVRNDGFSTFGVSNRRHWFPAATAAWNFTNYTTLGGLLSQGRVRAAYGETGTEPGVYLTNGFYSSGFFVSTWSDALLASQGGQGGLFTASRKPQNNLKPERQREFETGFDLGFLNDRADASFTYYNRKARDVIFDLPLPASTGYNVQASNAGTIRNSGIEASLNFHPVRSTDFDWDLGFQYAHNKNKVLDLQGAEAVDLPTGGFFTGTLVSAVRNNPIGVFRSYDFVRCRYGKANAVDIEGTGSPVDINAACQAAKAPNGALYIGPDGFPVEDPTQRVIGDPNPNWTGGIRTGLRWKKVSVSGLLDIRRGGVIWNGTRGALDNFGTAAETRLRANCAYDANGDLACTGNERTFGKDFMRGSVFGPGAGTAVPIGENWFTGLGSGFGDVASQFLEDGGFVKLREISVGYSFTGPWVRNSLGVTSLDLRLAGRNLATWTKYSGIDPETNLGGAEVAAQGIDYFNNPPTRSFVITLGIIR